MFIFKSYPEIEVIFFYTKNRITTSNFYAISCDQKSGISFLSISTLSNMNMYFQSYLCLVFLVFLFSIILRNPIAENLLKYYVDSQGSLFKSVNFTSLMCQDIYYYLSVLATYLHIYLSFYLSSQSHICISIYHITVSNTFRKCVKLCKV